MILTALHNLYDNLAEDPASGITPLKFAPQKISYRVTLKKDGTLFSISPVSDTVSKKNYMRHIVPEHEVRAGSKIP